MSDPNRREFLGTSLMVLPAAGLAPSQASASSTRLAIFSEAGQFNQPNLWLVGALVVDSPVTHARRLRELRLSLKFYTKLEHGDHDSFRDGFAKAILDYFFASEDMRFFARSVWKTKDVDYASVYRAVATVAMAGWKGRVILTRHRAPDGLSLEDDLSKVPGVTGAELAGGDNKKLWSVENPKPPDPQRIADADLPALASLLVKLLRNDSDGQKAFFEKKRLASISTIPKISVV